MPYYRISLSITRNPRALANIVALYSTKYAYFVNLSTITSIMSYVISVAPSLDLGNFVIKSIVTSSYSLSASSVNYRLPYFVCRDALFLWYESHFLIYSVTLVLIPKKVNL